jgi:hypothetical protein
MQRTKYPTLEDLCSEELNASSKKVSLGIGNGRKSMMVDTPKKKNASPRIIKSECNITFLKRIKYSR